MSRQPLGADCPGDRAQSSTSNPAQGQQKYISQSSSEQPGTSGRSPALVLTAPDLQLDCLESDDDDDDENGAEEEEAERPELHHHQSSSSDTALTNSTDSGEDGPSNATTRRRAFQRFRSASTSDSSVPQPKIRRTSRGDHPFGYHNQPRFQGSATYAPHLVLLRRQQLQRELQRRFHVDERGELELPFGSNAFPRRSMVSFLSSRAGYSPQFNRLLQLVSSRGLNMGLRPEVIEQYSSKSQFVESADEDAQPVKEEDREMCTICLVNFEVGVEIRTLNCCQHRFHSVCVDRWLQGNKKCPLCRLFVDNKPSQEPVAPDDNAPTLPAAASDHSGLPDS